MKVETRTLCPLCKKEWMYIPTWRSCYLCDFKVKREKRRMYTLKKDFGMTLENYSSLFERQNGLCAICQKEEKKKRLSIDHDHKTKKVRGLLCSQCNSAIGLFSDNIVLMKNAIAYLKKAVKK